MQPRIVLLATAIACLVACHRATTPTAAQPQATGSSVSGTVFYRLKSGEAVIMRASHIYLLTPAEVQAPLEDVTKALDFQVVKAKPFWGSGELFGDSSTDAELTALEEAASKASHQATTDVDGKYQFIGLTAGEYYLFTTLDSSRAKGFWYQRIDVPPDATLTVALDNTNITARYEPVSGE